jgi:hypothetical protein
MRQRLFGIAAGPADTRNLLLTVLFVVSTLGSGVTASTRGGHEWIAWLVGFDAEVVSSPRPGTAEGRSVLYTRWSQNRSFTASESQSPSRHLAAATRHREHLISAEHEDRSHQTGIESPHARCLLLPNMSSLLSRQRPICPILPRDSPPLRGGDQP